MEQNIIKPPTRIRVYYPDSKIGLYVCAYLCQLGYTVIVDRYYKDHPLLSKFHHIEIDLNGSMDYDYVFDNESDKNILYISRRREAKIWEYIKYPNVLTSEFVNFCIYHWGLTRGGRPLYEFPVIVDHVKINKWHLIPLVENYLYGMESQQNT